ncbi:hypothetical protein CONPUDRAFT_50513, partial [Coniophora puteana RWD-64-598 SS2]
VLGVYHAKVHYGLGKPEHFEFLHVCWFGNDPKWEGEPKWLQLDCIGYVNFKASINISCLPVFGFVDPNNILCACHLILAFFPDMTTELLPPSCTHDAPDSDWLNHYVMW